jgi:hypothetical protein
VIQDTSLAAYEKAKEQLGNSQACVYQCIIENPGLSNLEISEALGWPINRVTPRVLELRVLNLVIPGEKKIGRTGLKVNTWKANVLDYQPRKFSNPAPRAKKFKLQLELPNLSDS